MHQYNKKHLVRHDNPWVSSLGILDNDMVTCFWIGGHDEYEKFFS